MARRGASPRNDRSPAAAAIVELLEQRAPGKTICPSEAARLLDPVRWRGHMDEVRAAAAALAADDRVQILQRGRPVVGPTRGPIRIGRATTPMGRSDRPAPLVTPDGRYIVVKGRLWRRANPALAEATRQRWVDALMDARRSVARAKRAADPDALADARRRVNAAKVALGERGPVWWSDEAPDDNRRLAKNTVYAGWWADVGAQLKKAGEK